MEGKGGEHRTWTQETGCILNRELCDLRQVTSTSLKLPFLTSTMKELDDDL